MVLSPEKIHAKSAFEKWVFCQLRLFFDQNFRTNLTVGQNNFGNKIPIVTLIKIGVLLNKLSTNNWIEVIYIIKIRFTKRFVSNIMTIKSNANFFKNSFGHN